MCLVGGTKWHVTEWFLILVFGRKNIAKYTGIRLVPPQKNAI
jgi:hypothetical protein